MNPKDYRNRVANQNANNIINNNNAAILEPCDFSYNIHLVNGRIIKTAFDFTFVDTGSISNSHQTFDSIVTSTERAKITKYGQPCRLANITFHPIVFSDFGTAAPQAVKQITAVLKKQPTLAPKVLQQINLEILRYGGKALQTYWKNDF